MFRNWLLYVPDVGGTTRIFKTQDLPSLSLQSTTIRQDSTWHFYYRPISSVLGEPKVGETDFGGGVGTDSWWRQQLKTLQMEAENEAHSKIGI